MPTNIRPTATDSWHPADDNQGSDDEDVVVVTSKRRTTIGNLKIDENRTRAGKKRIHKNIIFVPIDGMIRWRFMYNRRIDAEEMMSEVTNKNIDMDILEGTCVMKTIEIVGLYRTKPVKRVIYNLNDDDSNNGKVHKGEKGNMVVNEMIQGVTQNYTNITDNHDDTGQSKQNAHKVVKDTVAENTIEPDCTSECDHSYCRCMFTDMPILAKWKDADVSPIDSSMINDLLYPTTIKMDEAKAMCADDGRSHTHLLWMKQKLEKYNDIPDVIKLFYNNMSIIYISDNYVHCSYMNSIHIMHPYGETQVESPRSALGISNTKEKTVETFSTYVVDTTDVAKTNIVVEKNSVVAGKDVDAIKIVVDPSAPIKEIRYLLEEKPKEQ
ncbi:hypothetical protein LIER_26180 [Lithospermum erythrorhizon]|uniref:C-type lectin domain-containing protein n=1 Tax=Lithospermum erythrorhizon TaxID=34254 RepID=A0AAV3RAM5_LITER